MPNNGTEVTDYATIKSLLDDKKGQNDKRPYFYIIKMPECGAYRLKIGKSTNIYARFKYYQEHFHRSSIQIKRLRRFPDITTDRYGDNAQKLYALFETEAQHALRDLNKTKLKNGQGKLTEWFDNDTEGKLLRLFDKFVDDFTTMKFDKTIKRKGLRAKNPEKNNISDSDSDDEEVVVKNKRDRNPTIRYNPRP